MQLKVLRMGRRSNKLLAPFDDETQALLTKVDVACGLAVKDADVVHAEMDQETAVWLMITKAYGSLYTRAIDAGWVKDVFREVK